MNRKWYIHKMPDKYCDINPSPTWPNSTQTWGPYDSQDEAAGERAKLVKQKICLPNE